VTTSFDSSPSARSFRLRSTSFGVRIGLTALLLVFAIGLAASVAYIHDHHQNKDGEPGVSMTDLRGTYHGVSVPSPLRMALEANHPAPLAEPLPPATRTALLEWLGRDDAAISRDYDNLDLGDLAPSELIASNCLTCHGRADAAAKGGNLTLDSWESVKKVAFGKEINPPPISILIISTHAHALTLAALAALLILLLAFTRFGCTTQGWIGFFLGVGLLADISGWWLARKFEAFVYAIVAGGAIFNLAFCLALLLLFLELWLPSPKARPHQP